MYFKKWRMCCICTCGDGRLIQTTSGGVRGVRRPKVPGGNKFVLLESDLEATCKSPGGNRASDVTYQDFNRLTKQKLLFSSKIRGLVD